MQCPVCKGICKIPEIADGVWFSGCSFCYGKKDLDWIEFLLGVNSFDDVWKIEDGKYREKIFIPKVPVKQSIVDKVNWSDHHRWIMKNPRKRRVNA